MRATKTGIEVNKSELNALLAFTGDDMKFSTVHFRVNGSAKLVASATDGKRAVEVTAPSEGAERGEWAFDRTFIESVRRVLDDGETIAVLEVHQKGANKAVIKGIESGDKRTEIKCPSDSVSTQITMEDIHSVLGGTTQASGSWFAINAFYLSDIQAVAKAAEKCPVSLFPGPGPRDPVVFEARAAGGAWRGVVMPVPVIGPGDELEKEPDEEPPPGTPEDKRPLKLEAQLATEKKRRAKATKKTKSGRKAKAKAN